MNRPSVVEELYRGAKPLSEATVGDELGSMPFIVTDAMVARNAWANDDYHPWYLEESPFGGRIVSPVFLASFDAQLFYGFYAYPDGGSLFAKQEFQYFQPVMVGVEYTFVGRLVDIYERRGRTFYRARIGVVDATGDEVVVMHKTVAAPVTPIPAERA